jgi:serine/threonine protein kinase
MALVTGAASDWQAPEPCEWLDVASNFRSGELVAGRFRIRRFVGRGGMGEVYEAIDERDGQRVALKAVLAATCDNRHMLRSFRREARLGRRVKHPNVCRVHGSPGGTATRSPVPFFTMEFIEGETLTDRLSGEPLSIDAALVIAEQLLLGLRAIHEANVLHLDIKASNIMLRDGCERRPVILDFGLARHASSSAHSHRVRPLTGSLAYMPPEQILGRDPGAQNDVFAFGVVLFQMLTGTLPFPVAPSTRSSIVERLTAHAPKPSSVVRRLPRWLDEVVLTCLAEQEQRFSSVEAVMEGLKIAF